MITARQADLLVSILRCREHHETRDIMPFTWINEPPIVEITNKSLFQGLFAQFMTKLYASKLIRPATNEAVSWNVAIDNSIRDFNRITTRIPDWRGFVYMVAGMPIGLMVISQMVSDECIRIHYLATHPQAEGGNGILIEHAVNLSENNGYNGRVTIGAFDSLDGASYEALGFILAQNNSLRKLDPSESGEWVKVGTEWRLKQYWVRNPLDNWREYTIGAQITGRVRRRNFGFLT